MAKEAEVSGTGGWVVHYPAVTGWHSASSPTRTRPFTARFRTIERGNPEETSDNAFETSYVETAVRALAPGESLTSTSLYFCRRSKELDVLCSYVQNDVGIEKFDMLDQLGLAVVSGANPLCWLLHILEGMTGHFGHGHPGS